MATFRERKAKAYKVGAQLGLGQRMYESMNPAYTTHHKNTLGAIAHQNEYEHEVKARAKALGPQFLGTKHYNPVTGEAYAHKIFKDPHTGKVQQLGKDGEVVYNNKAHVEERQRIRAYEKSEIDKYMVLATTPDDEFVASILQMTLDELRGHVGEGAQFSVNGVPISKKMAEASGMPSELEFMVPKSKEQLAGVAKLRALVKLRLPYIAIADFGTSVSDKNKQSVTNPMRMSDSDFIHDTQMDRPDEDEKEE